MRRNLTLAEQVAAVLIALAIGAGVKLSTDADAVLEEPAIAVNAIPEAPVKVGGTYYTASGSNSNSVVLSNTATTTSWSGVTESAVCGQGPYYTATAVLGSPEITQACRLTRYARVRDGKAEGSNDGAYWVPIYTPPAR